MRKILSILFILISFSSFSQKYLYECNCEERGFRQTFEIDTINQTIRLYSSISLSSGQSWKGNEYPFESFWIDNQAFNLDEKYGSVRFYHWNLLTNEFISKIYQPELFLQEYKCFIIKPKEKGW